ncbi:MULTISPECIES: golvesin C-terminal-like domain-containing protein [Butyricimonas]|uniref:golvesin C-terminal-like domain-containing protein n=1 Tax=Butyricimonas TaxID=574697 RepID=UPI001D095F61|nr:MULTISPECIES: hypothetical protein [Butyricimonas]MCB6974080.1 hypothetical protein [Butyricimonas synergistica]MCG4520858.1 hypothetical protein [Butyricimonas sp. DFI.6.44]
MNYRTIGLIARYEAKAITREWSFKVVTVLSVLIVAFLHVITQSSIKEPEWIAISLPSAIPFANVYLVNILQIIIAIFWAGNFLREDKYVDANSSVSARPFSNMELLLGKTLGFILVILCLDILLGIIALSIHLLASDSPFVFSPYVFYFLTITCPILFFITGFTICVKGIARNFALACVLLLAFLYFGVFFGKGVLYGAFDILALGMPNAFSDVTGFADSSSFLLQRFSFLAWGCGLIILGITFICRISNSAKANFATGKFGILLLVVGFVVSGFYVGKYVQRDKEREVVRDVFVKYQNLPKVNVLEHDINFKQEGYAYLASSKLKVYNPYERKIDSVVLYLNPGLEVLKLASGKENLSYRRERQVIVLAMSMQPGETKEIGVDYRGGISPAVCYAEVVNIDSLAARSRGYYMYNMGRDYYYLRPDYTLLTPECLWYPTSKPTVNVNAPYFTEREFTRFKLTVSGEDKRVPVAPGEESREGDNICFTGKFGVSGLTLCIGDYVRKGIQNGDVFYEVFLLPGHEYLLFKELDMEIIFDQWNLALMFDRNSAYVYDKLNLVETPVHFCAYSRDWKGSSEYVHSGIVYRPEREPLFRLPFKPMYDERENFDPSHEFLWMYRGFLVNDLIDMPAGDMFLGRFARRTPNNQVKNANDISSLLQKDHYNVFSPEFAGIDLLFHMMQEGVGDNFNSYSGEFAIRYFKAHNLEEALQNPNRDIKLDFAIHLKGYNFFKNLLCSVPYEEFDRFNSGFMENHAFQCFSYEKYCEAVEEEFGIDFLDLTRQLYSERGLPAFYFRDARLDAVETSKGEEGHVFSIKVWNKGNLNGIVSISSYRGKSRDYFIPANACKEIKYYNEFGVSEGVRISTNFAMNNPSLLHFDNFPQTNRLSKPIEGIFDADTLAFAPEAGVYIVDNADPGCRVIEDRRVLDKVYNKRDDSYNGTRWHELAMENSYGELVKSYLMKRSGDGVSAVEWEVDLPESGKYELFVYNDNSVDAGLVKSGWLTASRVQTYRFAHAEGEETIELLPLEEANGWVSMGVYQFNAGMAKINLSGQGADPNQSIVADAVKWVKVK